MNTDPLSPGRVRTTALFTASVAAATVLAFPPAPHHAVYGVVRDEMGSPLASASAEVLLEAGGNPVVRTSVVPGMEPGANYRLHIPLDSGTTPDLYKPTALRPTVPFRMRVRIAGATYLPIEMSGAANLWTRPGAASRVDLTLGVDSDGDGLPDAWERAIIQMLGAEWTLTDVQPGDDADGDGIANLDEYLAGTYAFDPADGFLLDIAALTDAGPELEFTAIRGRTYTIHGSEDMRAWSPVPFFLPTDAADAPARERYQALDTRVVRARAGTPDPGVPSWRFFKLEVQ